MTWRANSPVILPRQDIQGRCKRADYLQLLRALQLAAPRGAGAPLEFNRELPKQARARLWPNRPAAEEKPGRRRRQGRAQTPWLSQPGLAGFLRSRQRLKFKRPAPISKADFLPASNLHTNQRKESDHEFAFPDPLFGKRSCRAQSGAAVRRNTLQV